MVSQTDFDLLTVTGSNIPIQWPPLIRILKGGLVFNDGTNTPFTTTIKGVTPVDDADLSTKAYVDGEVSEKVLTKNITFENPTATEDLSWFETPAAITITEVKSVLTGSATPSVTLSGILHDPDRDATGNNVLSSGVVVTDITEGHIPPLAGDTSIPAGSFVWVETSAQSGTVDSISLRLTYTED